MSGEPIPCAPDSLNEWLEGNARGRDTCHRDAHAEIKRLRDAVEVAADLLDFRTGKGHPGPIDPAMRDIVDRIRAALKVGA